MFIRNMLAVLKEGFYKPGHPLFRSGQNKIYDYFEGQLPKKEIEFINRLCLYNSQKSG